MQDNKTSGAAGRFVHALAEGVAIFGGLCLVAASILTGISILGGQVYKPLPGEIELVEMLCGLAVFAFLPFCQLKKGHVGVDLLINALGSGAIRWTQLIGDVIITGLLALIAWRHWLGTVDKFHNGEFTPILFVPLWWGYAASMLLLIVAVVVGFWCIYSDIRDIRRGAQIEIPLGGH
jgi:TRAP-type C4-dicarboxylate transport system permease small subunit